MSNLPVLWSFRRCPYAMRARLAIHAARVPVVLREILLKDKPTAFLAASPKGTVPVLDADGQVIEESREIMIWALTQNDPNGLLDMDATGHTLIDKTDGPFKTALDQTKYAVRFPERDAHADRQKASDFLFELDARLSLGPYLMGDRQKLADIAIAPFVRQFANTDRAWFDAQSWENLRSWLDDFLDSAAFAAIMCKNPLWVPGAQALRFPPDER